MVMCDSLMTMKRRAASVAAGEFKAKCLALLDEVEASGRTFVVTKRGRAVARVVPMPESEASLNGSLVFEEDLIAPVDVTWDATR